MKQSLVLMGCLLAAASSALAGEGTVAFANRGDFQAPITNESGARIPVNSTAYRVQLYAANGAGQSEASLVKVNPDSAFTGGTSAGYFNANARTITGLSSDGGIATVQVRAWKGDAGSTWETATIKGQSNVFDVDTGFTPETPPELVGMRGFALTAVPEPSTMALGVLGALGALAFYRRKNA